MKPFNLLVIITESHAIKLHATLHRIPISGFIWIGAFKKNYFYKKKWSFLLCNFILIQKSKKTQRTLTFRLQSRENDG